MYNTKKSLLFSSWLALLAFSHLSEVYCVNARFTKPVKGGKKKPSGNNGKPTKKRNLQQQQQNDNHIMNMNMNMATMQVQAQGSIKTTTPVSYRYNQGLQQSQVQSLDQNKNQRHKEAPVENDVESSSVQTNAQSRADDRDREEADEDFPVIPFYVNVDDIEVDWYCIKRSMKAVENERRSIMKRLSRSFDAAIESEEYYDLAPVHSKSIEDRIVRIEDLFDHTKRTLHHILRPIPLIPVSPSNFTNVKKKSADKTDQEKEDEKAEISPNAYMSATHIISHMLRDWTEDGAMIRESLYDWCIHQLNHYLPQQQKQHEEEANGYNVLVPGAALGRLAYDISTTTQTDTDEDSISVSYHVHAMEISLTMASAAYYLFHTSRQKILYPYALDAYNNEVDANHRYQGNVFPDIVANVDAFITEHDDEEDFDHPRKTKGSLKYTVGDFVATIDSDSQYDELSKDDGNEYKSKYDAVVTCFFIDTATNIYDYLDTIKYALKDSTNNNNDGGLWINVGPLQFHRNAELKILSTNELKLIIESIGFEILAWEVDEYPTPYRAGNNLNDGIYSPKSTNYQAYYPLRFVVRKSRKNAVKKKRPLQKKESMINERTKLSVEHPHMMNKKPQDRLEQRQKEQERVQQLREQEEEQRQNVEKREDSEEQEDEDTKSALEGEDNETEQVESDDV